MLNIINKSTVTTEINNEHIFSIIKLESEELDTLVSELIGLVPEHYIDPTSISDILARLGKSAAAQKLRDKIPKVKKIRSGDIGEIITADYIEESTSFSVPVKKLRWSDHANMAMRGDDVIGIEVVGDRVRFLKAEAKSSKSLSTAVMTKAREELDNDDGFPAPHALGFIIDRLKETGDTQLADKLEKVQLVDKIKSNQVEHLLFTLTSSNPATIQKDAFNAYSGKFKQTSIGFQVDMHQELIESVYEGIIDGLDD